MTEKTTVKEKKRKKKGKAIYFFKNIREEKEIKLET